MPVFDRFILRMLNRRDKAGKSHATRPHAGITPPRRKAHAPSIRMVVSDLKYAKGKSS